MAEQQIQINLHDILTSTHEKYTKIITALIKENAELQAGIEILGPRAAELEAERDALREQFNALSSPPAAPGPGGSGLLGASGQVLTFE